VSSAICSSGSLSVFLKAASVSVNLDAIAVMSPQTGVAGIASRSRSSRSATVALDCAE